MAAISAAFVDRMETTPKATDIYSFDKNTYFRVSNNRFLNGRSNQNESFHSHVESIKLILKVLELDIRSPSVLQHQIALVFKTYERAFPIMYF